MESWLEQPSINDTQSMHHFMLLLKFHMFDIILNSQQNLNCYCYVKHTVKMFKIKYLFYFLKTELKLF